jgi:Cu+-exporting ATPase
MGPPAAATLSSAVDPVCGLKVDPNAAPRADYQGQTYYFCSEQHRQLFSKDSAKYVSKAGK